MADQMYNFARQLFATAGLNWTSDTIKVILIDTTQYTFDITHQYLSSVPAGARVAVSGALANKSATGGACSADPVVFTSITGAACQAMIIFKDNGGDAATSPLICRLDSYSGLPVTPNGGNITVTWPTDANKIFRI
jgi:hypothetical protein